MSQVKEPQMLVTCSEVVELVEAYRDLTDNNDKVFNLYATQEEYLRVRGRFDWHYNKAATNLRKFNRRTMQDS